MSDQRETEIGKIAPCENHPSRPGWLAISLPSIGVHRYLCDECVESIEAQLHGAWSNDEPDWHGWEQYDYYIGREDSAYSNPNYAFISPNERIKK